MKCNPSLSTTLIIMVLDQTPFFAKSFQTATVSLLFLPCNVSHFQTGCRNVCIPTLLFLPFQFYLRQIGQIFLLIHFFIALLNVKPLFPISIDSFLDWEGHHWVSCSSHHCSQSLPSVMLLPMHLTRCNIRETRNI